MNTCDKAQIRAVLESVRDSTQHEEVRRAMSRAMYILDRDYDDSGLLKSVNVSVQEMAATQRTQRMLLWIGPVLTLLATLLLFQILRSFLAVI